MSIPKVKCTNLYRTLFKDVTDDYEIKPYYEAVIPKDLSPRIRRWWAKQLDDKSSMRYHRRQIAPASTKYEYAYDGSRNFLKSSIYVDGAHAFWYSKFKKVYNNPIPLCTEWFEEQYGDDENKSKLDVCEGSVMERILLELGMTYSKFQTQEELDGDEIKNICYNLEQVKYVKNKCDISCNVLKGTNAYLKIDPRLLGKYNPYDQLPLDVISKSKELMLSTTIQSEKVTVTASSIGELYTLFMEKAQPYKYLGRRIALIVGDKPIADCQYPLPIVQGLPMSDEVHCATFYLLDKTVSLKDTLEEIYSNMTRQHHSKFSFEDLEPNTIEKSMYGESSIPYAGISYTMKAKYVVELMKWAQRYTSSEKPIVTFHEAFDDFNRAEVTSHWGHVDVDVIDSKTLLNNISQALLVDGTPSTQVDVMYYNSADTIVITLSNTIPYKVEIKYYPSRPNATDNTPTKFRTELEEFVLKSIL